MRRERRQLVGQQLGVIGGLVRVRADRAPDARRRLRRSRARPSNSSSRVPIVSMVADPGGAGAGDHRRALGRELGEVEMAMAVDQHPRPALAAHAAGASTNRGKIALRFRQAGSGCQRRRRKRREIARPRRHGELIEELPCRRRHKGLHQESRDAGSSPPAHRARCASAPGRSGATPMAPARRHSGWPRPRPAKLHRARE